MGGGVLVFAEQEGSSISSSTLELIGAGRKLADELQKELIAVLMGRKVGEAASEIVKYGIDKALTLESPELEKYQPEVYVAALEKISQSVNPAILLFSHTCTGADLASRIAFRLGTAPATDCTDLAIDPTTGSLLCTKPIYGGNVAAVYASDYLPQVATIREKSFLTAKRDDERSGEVISFAEEVNPAGKRIRLLEKVTIDIPGVKLEEADVIVCGGRGIGDPQECDGLAQLYELAAVLGGAVAGSRPVCEKGWIHPRLQVGLTGKKVTPKLYIAIGVSGASQHLAGMSGSKTIVAINSDPKANMLKECHYGCIGDYREILPAFTRKLKELLNED